MKIVCAACKTVLGEQKPFSDPSEIKATCTACIEKTKEEAARFVPEPALHDGKKIVLENGIKCTLWTVKDKKDKLYVGDMVVSGKVFSPTKRSRREFEDYLASIPSEEADVTFLHTISCKLDPSVRGRRKKQEPPKTEEPKKNDSIHYNCTMRAPKHYIQFMYDDLAERMDKVTDLILKVALKRGKEGQQKPAQNGNKSTMSPKN